jgi:DNA-binding transcriptional LysR family regulator
VHFAHESARGEPGRGEPGVNAEDLKLFVEVARLGGFAAVARSYNLDPSSVSRAVAGLEAEIGVRLFQRSTRKLSLTEAGNLYLVRVSPLVEELNHARDEALAVSKGVTGVLRITASVAFGYQRLAPLFSEFRARHPLLKLEVLLTDANLNLVSDRIDVAVRLGSRFEGDVVCTKLMRTRYRVCASPSYLKSHGTPTKPSDLVKHQCLLLSLPEFRNAWHFKNRKGSVQDVTVSGDLVISNPLVQQRCAAEGMGPALLADWLSDEFVATGNLIDLFPHHDVTATTFDTGVWLLYPSRNYLPLKVRAIADFLREKFTN